MSLSDAELHATLLGQLREAGEVESDRDTMVLSGFPHQQAPRLRLHLPPALLGRAIRDLAPDYAEVFPLLDPKEAALVVLFVRVLAANPASGPAHLRHRRVAAR